MNINFLMKDLLHRKKIVFLLIIQTIIYVYFLINFFSINMFQKDYTKNYHNSFPINNGVFISDMESLEKVNNKQALDFLNYIDNNLDVKQYKLYLKDHLTAKDFNIDNLKYIQNYLIEGEIGKGLVPYYKLDYNYYFQIKEYIDGSGFTKEDFHKEVEFTPLILGKNFKKDYKIGDTILSNNNKIKFKVVGFLNKNLLIFEGDPIGGTNSLDGSFITPLNRKEFLDDYNLGMALKNIIIEFKDNINYKNAVTKVQNMSNKIGLNIILSDFLIPLNKFLEDIESQVKFESLKVNIFTVLSLGVFILSIINFINLRRNEIGILYAIGANIKDIIILICFDIIVVMILGYLISLPLYIHNSKLIVFFFVNNFHIKNFILAFFSLFFIGILSLIIPCYKIIKLKPKDLIGGFRQ
ncbi:FtsX-like permease family protein [Clostridium tetani]|uniref:FtsX-like permease family protein n=1 Tax=Clostridium tetani TaxID=1513 RepID=UPI0038B36CFF